jgi:hypothetical protein
MADEYEAILMRQALERLNEALREGFSGVIESLNQIDVSLMVLADRVLEVQHGESKDAKAKKE